MSSKIDIVTREFEIADYEAALKIKPDDYDTVQRLQYARGMLAGQNAPPPSPTPTPVESHVLTPLNIIIAVIMLIVIAVVVRLVTRGKEEPTSSASTRIR